MERLTEKQFKKKKNELVTNLQTIRWEDDPTGEWLDALGKMVDTFKLSVVYRWETMFLRLGEDETKETEDD